MRDEDIQYKLIRADFMVAKSHLEKISSEVEQAKKNGKRLTKSQIVRNALDQYFNKGLETVLSSDNSYLKKF